MDFAYSLSVIIATGFFYMILPVIFVKKYGKVSGRKAFLLSFLNWILIYVLFRVIYSQVFPDDISSIESSGPALWLFVSWKYMTVKNTNKNSKPHKASSNTINDLEDKFHMGFMNTYRETFTRKENKYALFIFKEDQHNMKQDQFIAVVVVNTQNIDFRYFVVEKLAVGNSFLLCEWIFDDKNIKVKHLNFGGIAESIYDLATQKVMVRKEVLIDQIDSIIVMKVEPIVTSTKSKSGWSFQNK